MRRQREEIEIETADLPRCAICKGEISPWDKVAKTASFRGEEYPVCGTCDRKYSHCVEQIAWAGFRFRFVERREIPRSKRPGPFTQIYKLLLLAKERQEIRRKEVKWMADEMTTRILKLPGRVAAIVRETFVVRGDDYKLADDTALLKIKDLLEESDPNIMNRRVRNRKKKRLS